jgi:hypothetical protein
VPKYKVIAHRRVHKFISDLKDENVKNTIKDTLTKLENYPIILREMDVEKIKGLKKTQNKNRQIQNNIPRRQDRKNDLCCTRRDQEKSI